MKKFKTKFALVMIALLNLNGAANSNPAGSYQTEFSPAYAVDQKELTFYGMQVESSEIVTVQVPTEVVA